MKRLLILICFTILAVGSVLAYNPYAPNQFDAMDRNSWEFKTVYSLSKDGLTRADMNKFSSSYALTRYEMAQMVATAIQHRNEATPEQRSQIDKLADVFSSDLEYLPKNDNTKTALTEEPTGKKFEWRQ